MISPSCYLSPEPLLQNPTWVRSQLRSGRQVPGYSYGLNNPIRTIDPDGRDPLTDLLGASWAAANWAAGGRAFADFQWYGWSQGGFGFTVGVDRAPLQQMLDPNAAVTLGRFTCYPTSAQSDPGWRRHETAHSNQYMWLDSIAPGSFLPMSLVGLGSSTLLTGSQNGAPLEQGPRDIRNPRPWPW